MCRVLASLAAGVALSACGEDLPRFQVTEEGRAMGALNARTGERLWEFQTGSGLHSNPVTYSVGGTQFVAVHSGWGGWVKGFAPDLVGAPRGDALIVFSLPE